MSTPRQSTRSTRWSPTRAAPTCATTWSTSARRSAAAASLRRTTGPGSEYLVEPRQAGRQIVGFGFVVSEVAHRGVLRSAVDRPVPAGQQRLQPRAVAAARAQPGVPAGAGRRQVLGGAEGRGDDHRPDPRGGARRPVRRPGGGGVPGAGAGRAPRRHRPRLPDRGQPDRRAGARRRRQPDVPQRRGRRRLRQGAGGLPGGLGDLRQRDRRHPALRRHGRPDDRGTGARRPAARRGVVRQGRTERGRRGRTRPGRHRCNAYFRLRDIGWQLVGFERLPER